MANEVHRASYVPIASFYRHANRKILSSGHEAFNPKSDTANENHSSFIIYWYYIKYACRPAPALAPRRRHRPLLPDQGDRANRCSRFAIVWSESK